MTFPNDIYLPPSEEFEKLETRHTGYRFDLKRDIRWADMDAPGVYFTDEMLTMHGMDISRFDSIDGFDTTLQWAMAIGVCEEFIAVERHFLGFFNQELSNGRLSDSHSIELLEEEEVYLHLLHRFANGLKAQGPEIAKSLDKHLETSFKATWWHEDHPGNYPSIKVYHFINWLHALFFEEYTLYFHHALKAGHDDIQPAWLSVHDAYPREEKQHVMTDVAYLEQLALDHETRKQWGHWFMERQSENGLFATTAAVREFLMEHYPGTETLPSSPFESTKAKKRCLAGLLDYGDAFLRTKKACGFSAIKGELFPDRRDEDTDATDARATKESDSDSDGDNPAQFGTLVDLLRHRAINRPDKIAYTFLKDGETEEGSLTYAQLDEKARAIAARLQEIIASGERALLLYPSGLEFIAAFFGCLYAYVVAVPTYPPKRNRPDPRFQAIAADTRASVALTTTRILSEMDFRLTETEFRDLHWLATDGSGTEMASHWQPPELRSDTLAFLQYTSGSTGIPKGVMVSYANLLHNLKDLDLGWGHTKDSVMVTWLPIFHDMGLIYGLLQPLYGGFPCYLMAPTAFLQQPFRWLKAISRYGGTHSAALNFAYDLCVQRTTPKQRTTLHLGSWRMTLNAAEPIRKKSIECFADTFAPCGFNPIALSPGYGLAEATLKVTAVRHTDKTTYLTARTKALAGHRVINASQEELDNPQLSQALVGCGFSEIDTRVVIVNPDTLTSCAADEIGEIWATGISMAQGYWNRPEETKQTFQAYLADTGEGPGDGAFLRTGDLGFLRDGELFVTGRLKDLIIIHGQNHYPQDIEITVEKCHPALQAGGSVAFSVEREGEERLVIVQEVQRTWLRNLNTDEVIEAIHRAVSEQHELTVHAILLLKPGRLPKTSSGKVQRRACRSQFLAEELRSVAAWQQPEAKGVTPFEIIPSPTEATKSLIRDWLIHRVAQSVGLPPEEIDTGRAFAYHGLDSTAAVGLSGELGEWLGHKSSLRRLPMTIPPSTP
uniref:Acyl-CoA synthetase (AMP-forming)/AMP-acid ligase II n=1 Tax=Candidatus Kentrum eta TaxID=2126337 RepID=A0A450VGE9_9GAMM|nr:MAG: Acyl-CoA synthetase (AMP-forming)/AMP-acid ligase II [Candidatus Kentron sp. H]VFJ99212.1 MAG: Acyl-CoA synthetase (AMP-forming)/AMP-acid ligase II [Candidatus Kentron sp. H]VFK03864.1 MAG: Acyl-CoA synthetase (AMP-forming)/AMP-acid ligase II [Candidatus Kentron sp. H]